MIHLKDRDFELIDFLKQQGWALSSQLSSRFFSGCRHTCSNRMRLLKRSGIIEAVDLNQFRKSFWHERALLNSICDLSGRIQVYRLSQNFRDAFGQKQSRNSDDSMVAHQVLLSRVEERLRAFFPELRAINDSREAANQAAKSDLGELPDLVIELQGLRLAIELERKARRGLGKYNLAYEERFESLVRHYDAVLYVMEKEDQLLRLAEKARGLRRVGFTCIFSMNAVIRSNRSISTLSDFVRELRDRTL